MIHAGFFIEIFMCQCAKRREVMVAASQGRIDVGQAARFVATSLLQDGKNLARAILPKKLPLSMGSIRRGHG